MKSFDKFGDYMFSLLFGPLKKGRQSINQFYIFFKVIGSVFDDMKQDIFKTRNEANVITASPIMLQVHGSDREMPRLLGEDDEGYRTRLSMKGIIAEEAGTKLGILHALVALGYEQSYIELFAAQDNTRWAEFIIFLKGKKQSSINNLDVIDAEVRKIKEASSKPSYGMDTGATIVVNSECKIGMSAYPRCNQLRCGVFPQMADNSRLISTKVSVQSLIAEGVNNYKECSPITYLEGDN